MKVLTRKETADYLRISLRTLARKEAKGEMPPRIWISPQRPVYREVDIDKILSGRAWEDSNRQPVAHGGVHWLSVPK